MILPDGTIGSAGFTPSSASLADAGALAAAALTEASAPAPAAIRLLRSLGSEASAAARSITDLPSTSPSAEPLPFSNIISFIDSLLASMPRLSYRGLSPYPAIHKRRSKRHDGSR